MPEVPGYAPEQPQTERETLPIEPRLKAVIERYKNFVSTKECPYPSHPGCGGGPYSDVAAVLAGSKRAAIVGQESLDPNQFSREVAQLTNDLILEAQQQGFAVLRGPERRDLLSHAHPDYSAQNTERIVRDYYIAKNPADARELITHATLPWPKTWEEYEKVQRRYGELLGYAPEAIADFIEQRKKER